MTEAEEMMRKMQNTLKSRTYFPLKIRVDEGKAKGRILGINRSEDIPLYVGFTVLETASKDISR